MVQLGLMKMYGKPYLMRLVGQGSNLEIADMNALFTWLLQLRVLSNSMRKLMILNVLKLLMRQLKLTQNLLMLG